MKPPPPQLPGPDTMRQAASCLRDRYGFARPQPSGNPLDELVATILSQHTSDANSHRAFAALKRRFPRWSQALAAGPAAVADAIRGGGLAEQKAPRIIALLETVPRDDSGEPSLDCLAAMEPQDAYRYLQGFGGVGPKTAACTLLFAYGWPVFPVDTHVHRVATRLGWARRGEPADKLQARMIEGVPPDATYDLHMGMVRHGREVCRPANPRCGECPVRILCQGCAGGEAGPASSAGEPPAGHEEGRRF